MDGRAPQRVPIVENVADRGGAECQADPANRRLTPAGGGQRTRHRRQSADRHAPREPF